MSALDEIMAEYPVQWAETERLISELAVPPYTEGAKLAVAEAIADALKRFSPTEFGGTSPAKNEIGIRPLEARDFNIDTFRMNYTTTGWQAGPINNFTLSKYTYIVVFAYEDPEPTVRVKEIQWTVGSSTWIPEPVGKALRESKDQKMGIEPFKLIPDQLVTLDVNVETTGYDSFQPVGVVVAPHTYLLSRIFMS